MRKVYVIKSMLLCSLHVGHEAGHQTNHNVKSIGKIDLFPLVFKQHQLINIL